MTDTKVISPRFSFKGWKPTEWLKGHWKTIKETAKVAAPLWFSVSQGWDPTVTALATAVFVGLASAIEYFLKEYKG